MSDNYCPHCKVYVKGYMTHCPICGKYLGGSGKGPTSYVEYPSGSTDRRSSPLDIAVNLTALITVLAALSNAAFFLITKSFDYRLLYGVYVLLAGALLLLCILLPVRRRRFKWKEAAAAYILLTLAVIAADLLTDLRLDFSIAYAAPSLALAMGIAAAIVAVVRRKLDLSNPLLTLIISVLLLIGFTVLNSCLYAFSVIEGVTLIPVYVQLGAGLLLLAVMLATRFKEHVKNLVKKFHV